MGVGKVCVWVLPATLRVSRSCGSWPGSFGLAQWQVGLPQRRMTALMEPGRRSPKRRNSSRSLERFDSNLVRASGMGSPLCVYIRSEVSHKKGETAMFFFHVAHPKELAHLTTWRITGA